MKRIKVNDADIAVIERNSRAILMSSQRHLYVVDKVKFEDGEETIKKLFKKTAEVKKVKYLVEAEVLCYNSRGKFVGVLNEESTERFMTWYNLDVLRQNWRDFKEELLAFELEVKSIKKEEPKADPICNCDGRDMPVYEADGKHWCPQCGYEVK